MVLWQGISPLTNKSNYQPDSVIYYADLAIQTTPIMLI